MDIKKYLANQKDINAIQEKIDTVSQNINDINSSADEVNRLTQTNNSDLSSVSTNLTNIESEIKKSAQTSTLQSLSDKLTEIETKINNTGGSNTSEWVYSDGKEPLKTLYDDVSILPHNVRLRSNDKPTVTNCGFFIPKVSGVHKITVKTGITGSKRDGCCLVIGTRSDFIQGVALICDGEDIGTSFRDNVFRDAPRMVFDNNLYLTDGNENDASRVDDIGDFILDYFGYYDLTSTNTVTFDFYCQAEEPVLLFIANKSTTTDLTLTLLNITVQYSEKQYK